jgi:hypothetical protein
VCWPRSVALERRWRILDRHGMAAALLNSAASLPSLRVYFDVRHFEPFVYAEMNRVLISMLA